MDHSDTPSAPDLISLAEREALLRRQSGFESLTVNELAALVGLMREVQFSTGEEIVGEGQVIDSVYILASGTAEVTKQVSLEGKQGTTFLTILNEGAGIGLKGAQFFSQTGLRTATVTATAPCLLLQLKITEFNNFLNNHPHLLQNLQQETTLMLRMRFIKEATPFAHLNNEAISGLASNVKEITKEAGEIIFSQDDVADNCYLICEGKLEISKRNEDGVDQVIAVLEPYSVFGEAALLNFARRSATIRTLTQCKLLILDKDILLELAAREKEAPDTLMTMMQSHCRPVRLPNILHQHRTTTDAQEITTLKNTATNQYTQLSKEGWYIWTKLDGNSTLQEITALFNKEYGRLDPQGVIQIIQRLVDSGFAAIDINEMPQQGGLLKLKKEKSLLAKLWHSSYIFKGADKKISFLYKNGGFLLVNLVAAAIAWLTIITGIVLFYKTMLIFSSTLRENANMGWLLFSGIFFSMICQLINPLIQALAIKKFNHEVPYFGIIWHLIFPEGFVDGSDLWLGSRWIRIRVLVAGISADLFIASVLVICAYETSNDSIALFLWLSSLMIYLKTLRNFNPMINSAGYNLLSYLFDKAQLRDSALEWLTNFERKPIPQNNYYPEKYFWFYTILYFASVLVVITSLLSQMISIAIYSPNFKLIVLSVLALGMVMELVLQISQGKDQNASQIL